MDIIVPIKLSAVTVPQNSTAFGEPIPFKFCTGFGWTKLTVTAGSISASWQVALEERGPWFDPVDKDNVAVAVLVSTGTPMGVGTRFISSAVPLAQWIRPKYVERNVAACVVTGELIFQESQSGK